MNPNRFIQAGGDPRNLSVRTLGMNRWGVYCDGALMCDGSLYAMVWWVATAKRLGARRV